MRNKKVSHNGPTSGLLKYGFGRLWMWLIRWKVAGELPAAEKFIIVGAPHTSNWDFPLALVTCYVFRLKIAWMGKHTLFKKPFGGFMRSLGGIAIERDSKNGIVDQMVEKFNNSKKLVVAIAASGTRKKSDYWKSGFYWIAHKAQVPIICGYLDYSRKEAGFGLSFIPSGDIKNDMDRIRNFYFDINGKHPELATAIKVRDEE
ncbi:MAG: acyltransferase [Calditrichaeota bacterium]|nr:MAG: acyltransferase [Calditrichota bacterium]